jgi:hypothetical protein
LAESQRPLLQGKQEHTSALGWDAFFGDGLDNFVECDLHIGDCLWRCGVGVEGVGPTKNLCDVRLPAMIAVVEVTELFSVKSGRAAKDAIGFAMVAGRAGH